MSYPFQEVEIFAKEYWAEHLIYKVSNNSNKPKYYVLDMFPYPSGAGLHVGHPLGYIASDIISRYKRQCGYNVLHPMGFDAFGLPAEQYAIQTGRHPKETTEENIQRYKEQLDKIGFCYDWDREFRTSDPEYYKWTQWIFSQLFEHYYDIQEGKARPITDLINQFEENGTHSVHAATASELSFSAENWASYEEHKKSEILMNYRLAYTDYAMVNWCQELGTVLANDEVVNGKSERGGYPVERRPMRQWFLRITAYADRLLNDLVDLDWSDSMKEMQRNWIGRSEGASVFFDTEIGKLLEVFTTRPDTIFGVSFMVIAPEHPMLEDLVIQEQKHEVEAYISYVKGRTDVERQSEKKVSGVFTGSYAIHPFTGSKIPIYTSEYVLIGYGTGAIMAVPSDDERDRMFAEKFGLDIMEVVEKPEGISGDNKIGKLVNSSFLNGLSVKEAIQEAISKIEEKEIGSKQVNYRLRDAGFSRQRYWGEPFPIIYDKSIPELVTFNEYPTLPDVESYKPTGDGNSPLAAVKSWVEVGDAVRETDTMPGYAGSSWYFLRYMDPSNKERFVGKEAEEYWENVDLYIGGTEHAVGHLMYSRFWQKFLYDLGEVSQIEPFKRLVNQGMIQGRSLFLDLNDGRNLHIPIQFADRNDRLTIESWSQAKKLDNRLEEVPDHEISWVEIDGEKFIQLRPDIEKMSKSKFNVVNPDDIITQYGADVFRMFEMFLGPIEQHKPWDTKGIDGVAKFMRRFWALFYDESGLIVTNDEPTKAEMKAVHQCIKKVQDDIERMSFNTCISAFMIVTNELTSLKSHKRDCLEPLVKLIAPFAPFTAEKIFQDLGANESVVDAEFPKFEASYLIEDEIEYPVSINGKMRKKISLANGISPDDAKEIVLNDEVVQKWVEDKPIRKFIFVPGRIINIVV